MCQNEEESTNYAASTGTIGRSGHDVMLSEMQKKLERRRRLADGDAVGVRDERTSLMSSACALQLAQSIIDDCPCAAGCPACVTSLPPGVEDEELEQLLVESNASVACTQSLIKSLLTGEVHLPEVTEFAIAEKVAVIPPDVDEEYEKMVDRLGKASKILQSKRQRIH